MIKSVPGTCALVFLGAITSLCSVAAAQDEFTLFQSFTGTTTYLVDAAGAVVNSWPGTDGPGLSVYLTPAGDVVRTQKRTTGPAGVGGGIQRLAWDGTLEWDFDFFSATLAPHHDIEVLPNGNVLMIVYDFIPAQEAVDQGRDPLLLMNDFWPDRIIEVQQTGATTGTIVWEWSSLDHAVQDFDAGKPNFADPQQNPQLIDINYPASITADWLHFNGIDYNPFLDQIAVSVPRFNEVWIIDHSTTTAEAAGHSGGASGKGGDLLYRWGNPAAYRRGTAADRVLYSNHDVTWIEPGRPGAGNLLVFNNGVLRPMGDASSVDEFAPPVDANGNYTLISGQAFGPAALTWTYIEPVSFFSPIMGGAQRLTNGNTLITEAVEGRMFEVTPAGAIVHDYTTPFEPPFRVFKARRYGDCTNGCPVGIAFCFGDGSGNACPCGNTGGAGEGCATSTGSGMTIGATGSTSISSDTLTLTAEGVPGGNTGIFYVGRSQFAGNVLFDGLQCTGGDVLRFRGQLALTSTVSDTGLVAQDLFDLFWTAGTTYHFQYFTRDNQTGASPCSGFANLSHGLSVTMTP